MRRRTIGIAAGLLAGYTLGRWITGERATPEAVAHRGGSAQGPENTLGAFRNALAAGIPNWEMDVQLTTDGALAVFHDETLDRTTDGSGPLLGHSLAELKALDAGAWFGEAEEYLDRVLIMSFEGDSLERVRALDPDLPLCHLWAGSAFSPPPAAADAETMGPMWQLAALNPLSVLRAHEEGREVYTWTVNSAAALWWLRFCGVDGIISDRLDLLATIV
jgi:glycerophosphoryl diester phosphodiesterase